MPLTPLHLGPGLFLGVFTLKVLNLWALLLGSIIMDIEPAILLTLNIFNKCYGCPDHSFFHTIFGAVFGSLILAIILWQFRQKLNQIFFKFKIQQSFSFPVLFFSSLIAWIVHIFFDSLTHLDVFPFWPLTFNPFFIGPQIYLPLNLFLLILGIISLMKLIKLIRPIK